ncbi:MAG: DUF4411 family protein [Flavobacteriia bacterium]|nr:DUF4411 family protein [Flavobacteriia bacterium]
MKYIFDTNTLVNLYRYVYQICENKDDLIEFFENMVADEEVLVLEKVLEECSYHQRTLKGELFPIFDTDAHFIVNKSGIIATGEFISELDKHLLTREGALLKKSEITAFEARRTNFLRSADAQMVIYALDLIAMGESVTIVSEESRRQNDGKEFKKLPIICDHFKVSVCSLADFLNIMNARFTFE